MKNAELKKIDLRIMTWTWLMFVSLDLNRRNINRAITDNILGDLGKSFLPSQGNFKGSH